MVGAVSPGQSVDPPVFLTNKVSPNVLLSSNYDSWDCCALRALATKVIRAETSLVRVNEFAGSFLYCLRRNLTEGEKRKEKNEPFFYFAQFQVEASRQKNKTLDEQDLATARVSLKSGPHPSKLESHRATATHSWPDEMFF